MLLGPVASLALLVLVAGAAKVQAPGATATALVALGVPAGSSRGFARVLGVVEVVIGVWALLLGSAPAALGLAVLHLGFAGVTAALRRRPSVPCGCFGAQGSPATTTGLVVNLLSAAVALAAVVRPPGSLAAALADDTVPVVATIVVAAVGAWLLHELHGGRVAAGAGT